jgi:hypothetical protein
MKNQIRAPKARKINCNTVKNLNFVSTISNPSNFNINLTTNCANESCSSNVNNVNYYNTRVSKSNNLKTDIQNYHERDNHLNKNTVETVCLESIESDFNEHVTKLSVMSEIKQIVYHKNKKIFSNLDRFENENQMKNNYRESSKEIRSSLCIPSILNVDKTKIPTPFKRNSNEIINKSKSLENLFDLGNNLSKDGKNKTSEEYEAKDLKKDLKSQVTKISIKCDINYDINYNLCDKNHNDDSNINININLNANNENNNYSCSATDNKNQSNSTDQIIINTELQDEISEKNKNQENNNNEIEQNLVSAISNISFSGQNNISEFSLSFSFTNNSYIFSHNKNLMVENCCKKDKDQSTTNLNIKTKKSINSKNITKSPNYYNTINKKNSSLYKGGKNYSNTSFQVSLSQINEQNNLNDNINKSTDKSCSNLISNQISNMSIKISKKKSRSLNYKSMKLTFDSKKRNSTYAQKNKRSKRVKYKIMKLKKTSQDNVNYFMNVNSDPYCYFSHAFKEYCFKEKNLNDKRINKMQKIKIFKQEQFHFCLKNELSK